MPTSHLLNTRTATFTELIGNGKRYQVPAYQRNYSWTEEQWEDLWNDIEALEGAPDERHYMGALVVEIESEREFLIIDGQQRLTTLSLLVLAVIDRLSGLGSDEAQRTANVERALLLRRQFIGDKNPTSLMETSKLTLGEGNRGFYHDNLVQLRAPLNPRGLSKSNRQLWACFEWFKRRLDARADSGERLARLLDQVVGLQLMFILITVDDELSAYTVFETLNARGLELSTSDLLKNWLFSRVQSANDREVLLRRWETVLAKVREERFSEFLRYHLLCSHRKVRKERLFKVIRDSVPNAPAVFALMDALEPRAELFAALDDQQHGYWGDLPAARPHVRELQIYRSRQLTPILFAAWEQLPKEEFPRVLKMLAALSFRHTVVGGRNTNELEPLSHEGASALLQGRAHSPGELFHVIRGAYVDDERFARDFAEWSIDTRGQRKQLAKLVLCRLESDASGTIVNFETDTATIEHVLPENPDAVWDAEVPREQQAELVYRLGNLTLLEASANRQIGRGLLVTKRLAFEASRYALSRQIAAEESTRWTSTEIEERQTRLARRAAHIWRSDFA